MIDILDKDIKEKEGMLHWCNMKWYKEACQERRRFDWCNNLCESIKGIIITNKFNLPEKTYIFFPALSNRL
jgi:hypothetical protein